MKRALISAFMILFPMLVFAQTQFVDGTEWIAQQTNTADPSAKKYVCSSMLDGTVRIDGYDALKMYCKYEGESTDKKLSYYVRTENDKIYFMPTDTDNWFLMYDFGLKAGQGCYVYSPLIRDSDNTPLKSYVKCVNIEDAKSADYKTMTMEEYRDETCSEACMGKGTWLKGLSSENGVDYNIGFGRDGMGSLLSEVRRGENVIYSRNTNSMQQVSNSGMNYSVNGLNLSITGIGPSNGIRVYSADGKLFGYFNPKGNEVNIRLPQKGLYILRTGEETKKILLRKD